VNELLKRVRYTLTLKRRLGVVRPSLRNLQQLLLATERILGALAYVDLPCDFLPLNCPRESFPSHAGPELNALGIVPPPPAGLLLR
jgi:hypothetical protein